MKNDTIRCRLISAKPKFNRFKEVDILRLSSVTTYRPSSSGTSCSKYDIKLKMAPASIIEDMLTEGEAVGNSEAMLKSFEDTHYVKNSNHINDSFEVFCDVKTGSVICKNKNKSCYRFPTLKICQHCLAILIKTSPLETFVTNYNKNKHITLGRLVEFDNEKILEKRRERRQKNESGPQMKNMYQLERSYPQSSKKIQQLECQQLIRF